MKEEWRDIGIIDGIDYTGLYQCSNTGLVRSLERKVVCSKNGDLRTVKERKLSICNDKNCYCVVNLSKEGKSKMLRVHRIEAITFELPIPEHLKHIPIEQLEVDHIDTNPSNNRLDNLRWTDDWGNANNPKTKQHMSEAQKGEKCWFYGKHHTAETKQKISKANTNGKHSKPILQLDKETNIIIAEFPSLMEIKRKFNYDASLIIRCCKNNSKSAYGFKWRYAS